MSKRTEEEIKAMIAEFNRIEVETSFNYEQDHIGVWKVTMKETGKLFCFVSEIQDGNFMATRSSGIKRIGNTFHEAVSKLNNALMMYAVTGVNG